MVSPPRLAQRQEDLGPAGFFAPEAVTPAANQIRVKAGYALLGGYGIVVATADQLTAGFATVTAGQRRYDLVYVDKVGAVGIQQGTAYAVATAAFQGAPGWTGTNPGPAILDHVIPVAWVYVDEASSVTIATADITQINGFLRVDRDLDGFLIDKGLLGAAPTGASDAVTALFAGESNLGSASAPFVVGIITTAPYNVVEVLDHKRDAIQHTNGSRIYARLTWSGSVWTLSYYYTDASGAETAVSAIETDTTLGSGLTDIRLYRVPKIYSRHDPNRPMFADPWSAIKDQAASLVPGQVPLGGVIEWSPPTSPPVLPFGFEYADGQAVTTVGSPFLPASMPGYLKPIRMKSAAGGTQRFGRGADFSVGTHGAANAEPTGGTDSIPGATPATDSQGGSTPVSGSLSGSTDPASVAHTHSISNYTHTHASQVAAPAQVSTASAAATLVDDTHNHGGATGAMSGNDPHSHALSSPFSATVNTAHTHTVVSHDHGGENRPAFQDIAVIIRVL